MSTEAGPDFRHVKSRPADVQLVDPAIHLGETHMIGAATEEWLVRPHHPLHHFSVIGMSEARAPYWFRRPHPVDRQIMACLDGEGRVLVDGQWLPCARGDVYVTPAGQTHAYEAVGQQVWKLAWAKTKEPPGTPSIIDVDRPTLINADCKGFSGAVQDLVDEAMSYNQTAFLHAITELVSLHVRRIVGGQAAADPLVDLWAEVERDLARPWTVEMLGKIQGVGVEQLRRLCHRHTGQSPLRHLTALRMRRAASLLPSQVYTIAAIAERVGYTDPFAFSTAFRRATGVSPSEFRRTHSE